MASPSSPVKENPAGQNDLRSKIMAIMRDTTMTEQEKARKRQELLMGNWSKPAAAEPEVDATAKAPSNNKVEAASGSGSLLDDNLKCAMCLSLCERPVTAPCQHNFCLGCFKKWTYQGKKTCPSCRAPFPSKFAENPRINTALTFAIRLAKNPPTAAAPAKNYKRINNECRPDQAYVTDKAVRNGRANAASGRIMVTTPNDHFGPIGPEHDPSRNQGVLVGEWWKDRLDCRQWGAHFPHVAGIAGQSGMGAQSVVLSGGYEDDRDEGEWFLYTGSGGRDLSGNKRTSKVQSFDQDFENMNKALKLSCIKGMPVRVVRSFKEKRSSYAPTSETPVRYDGIYRILRCWRKPGNQKFLMCRYLFVRCDNSPAPWSSAETGDAHSLEVPEEAMKEIKQAKGQVFEMCSEPSWGWLADKECWGWTKEPPASQRVGGPARQVDNTKKLKKKLSEHEKALKEFKCGVCLTTLKDPLSTPCGHNFCKGCLDKKFEGVTDIQAPNAARTLRVRRNMKPCPTCKADLCDFLANAQVNREMQGVIQTLKEEVARTRAEAEKEAAKKLAEGNEDGEGPAGEEGEEGNEQAADEEGQEEDEDAIEDADDAEDEAGSSGASGSAAPSAAAPAAAPAAPAAAAEQRQQPAAAVPQPPAPKAPRFAAEADALLQEFPAFDRELVLGFLEEQGGCARTVRTFLRKCQQDTRKPAAPRAAAKGKGQKRGRKAKEEAEAVEDEAEEAEEPAAEQAGPSNAGAKGQDAEEVAGEDGDAKVPKQKETALAAGPKSKGKAPAKKQVAEEEEEDAESEEEEEEEARPKKKPAARAAKGNGPAGKKGKAPVKRKAEEEEADSDVEEMDEEEEGAGPKKGRGAAGGKGSKRRKQ